jgi:hypothetical protein
MIFRELKTNLQKSLQIINFENPEKQTLHLFSKQRTNDLGQDDVA